MAAVKSNSGLRAFFLVTGPSGCLGFTYASCCSSAVSEDLRHLMSNVTCTFFFSLSYCESVPWSYIQFDWICHLPERCHGNKYNVASCKRPLSGGGVSCLAVCSDCHWFSNHPGMPCWNAIHRAGWQNQFTRKVSWCFQRSSHPVDLRQLLLRLHKVTSFCSQPSRVTWLRVLQEIMRLQRHCSDAVEKQQQPRQCVIYLHFSLTGSDGVSPPSYKGL